MPTPADAVKFIDHASGATDRWLFICALVFIIGAGIWIIRELRKDRSDLLTALGKQQETHGHFVTTVYTEGVKLTAQVLVALQDNNKLLDRLGKYLDRVEQHPHGH